MQFDLKKFELGVSLTMTRAEYAEYIVDLAEAMLASLSRFESDSNGVARLCMHLYTAVDIETSSKHAHYYLKDLRPAQREIIIATLEAFVSRYVASLDEQPAIFRDFKSMCRAFRADETYTPS